MANDTKTRSALPTIPYVRVTDEHRKLGEEIARRLHLRATGSYLEQQVRSIVVALAEAEGRGNVRYAQKASRALGLEMPERGA
jgi:hypothetical protein